MWRLARTRARTSRGPSITTAGINADHTTISNVAPGVNGTDAVNLNQLNSGMATVNSRVDSVARKACAGVASAFVGPDHVKRITPGLGKDQVRLELGNPHFNEGIFAVREWDYAFNFYTGKGNEYVTCQYKIQFDSVDGPYRVASTHWKDGSCERHLNPVVAQAAPAVVAAPAAPRRITLSADGLFAFGKSRFDDLLPAGQASLQAVAADFQREGMTLTAIEITGHTDRIGSDAANQALSQARADSVRDYLASQRLERRLIQARGAGQSQPVVQCPGHKVTPQLVACLQPNRRVEMAVQAQN